MNAVLSGIRISSLVVVWLAASLHPVFGQAPGTSAAAGTDEILTTRDGFRIRATYFASTSADGKQSPVVILLPSADGSDARDARTRRVYEKLAQALQKGGYAAVSVDLRKHGDSLPEGESATAAKSPAAKLGPNDHMLMATSDLEAVKEFLLKEHHNERLNIAKTGIVAAGSSAVVAAAFSAADWSRPPYQDAPVPAAGAVDMRTPRGQDVRAIFMFSPQYAVKGLNTPSAMKLLREFPVAMHIVVSSKDRAQLKDAERIFKGVELKGEEYKKFRELTQADVTASREKFLEGRLADTSIQQVVEFMNAHLKELDQPWRSRRSRL